MNTAIAEVGFGGPLVRVHVVGKWTGPTHARAGYVYVHGKRKWGRIQCRPECEGFRFLPNPEPGQHWVHAADALTRYFSGKVVK